MEPSDPVTSARSDMSIPLLSWPTVVPPVWGLWGIQLVDQCSG
jgi:hypothetical protein